MPSLLLTDAQVADVATYLSTLKGSAGDPRKASPDSKTADEVLLDYLKNVMPLDDARAQMAKMNAQQKQIELGQRAISRYGCFSCHEIKGFENAQSIGTDLSEEGSKLVTRLDFAFITDIPHTSKIAWFRTKLHDPRIFDKGRVLQPLEKLRMPNYDFTDDEIQRLVTAIMSFQRDIQPPAAMPARSARYDFLHHDRSLPDARDRTSLEHRACWQGAVREAAVPEVSRARHRSKGSADVEPRARSAHDAGAAESGLDSRLAEEALGHPARDAHAGILARLSEIVHTG